MGHTRQIVIQEIVLGEKKSSKVFEITGKVVNDETTMFKNHFAPNQDDVNKAEQYFLKLAKENGDTNPELTLEDGFYEKDGEVSVNIEYGVYLDWIDNPPNQKLKAKEYEIAYQTVDPENDIWCNKAILFNDTQQAIDFFNNKELLFNTFDFELLGNETMEDVTLEVFQTKIDTLPYLIELYCQYAGIIKIQLMSKAFVIS